MFKREKFLIIGWSEELKEYVLPQIIYADTEELAVRGYNHHYRDYSVEGIIIGKFKYENNKGFTKIIEETYNNFSLEETNKWYANCWDAGIGGQIGNLDASWELSDLTTSDDFILVNEYLPEDLCTCLYSGRPGDLRSFTKDCVVKLDDCDVKFSHRLMINPNDDNEKIEWIEEWSKRQLKNAKNLYSFTPAYHWVLPKSFADRVVGWRWFKEGERKYQYM